MSHRSRAHELPSEEAVQGQWWFSEPRHTPISGWTFPESEWDTRVLAHIDEHLEKERGAIDSYDALADAGDESVKYVTSIITQDERRHHRIFEDIADSLRAEIAGKRSTNGVPVRTELDADQRRTLLGHVHRLLDIENGDAVALKELRHDLRDAEGRTLWPLLTEMMELDTQKHIQLLKGLEHLLSRD